MKSTQNSLTKRPMRARFHQVVRFLKRDIWRIQPGELSPRKSFLIRQLRILILAIRGFNEDQVHLRASALTYYSIFGLIPVMALAFGIAKGFGLENYVEEQLSAAFAGREEVFNWVMTFSASVLQTASGGMVAGIGLLLLLYIIVRVLSNIEDSFNDIWQIKQGRSWTRKFSDYIAIIFIAPIFFILSSITTVFLSAAVQDISESFTLVELLSPVLLFLVRLVPYLLVWLMFLIIYLVIPNTRVHFTSALIAAIVAGTLFQLTQWGYVYFQVGVSRYNALYGSFAALPLLLLWMRVSWLIVLFGAEISYANQNVENYEFEAESQHISPFNKKMLSLYVLHLLVQHFATGSGPLRSEEIATRLQMPSKLVRSILNDLTEVGLVVETRTEYPREQGFQPATDIHRIRIGMVLDKLDRKGMDILIAKPSKELDNIKRALRQFHEVIDQSGTDILVKDLSAEGA